MANNVDNLIPFTERTKEEQRKIAIQGGKASGEARRQKATMLSVLEKVLDEQDKESGLTHRELATLGLVKGAEQGIAKNYEILQNLIERKEKKDEEQNITIELPAKDVASQFTDVYRSILDRDYREYYMEGGRGSTKSSFISEVIITLLENNPRMCAVVLRKVKDTLKDSVFAQLEWAIDTLDETYPGIKSRWKLTKSPLEITNLKTGQVIYFRGADDYGKIKSLKPPKDMYVGITWYEEFDQFAGMMEVRKINQSLIRGGDDFIQFYSYNTPASSQHFVNIEKITSKNSRLVHLSDYRTVPKKWLGQAFIDEAEYLKEVNDKLYRNEYLGEMTGVGGNVFENIELREITNEEINTFDNNYYGLDFGWIDPVAFNSMYYNPNRRELYIYEELHGSKISNEKLGEMLEPWRDYLITCDSAEPKSINDLKSYGYFAKGAEKGPGSVEYSMKWLASLSKIVIDPKRCPYTTTEFSTYEYEQDKDGNYISAYPDGNDHHISAVRYGMERVWKKKGQ